MFSAITIICCLCALTLFVQAAWTDRTHRLIANRISILICAAFVAAALSSYLLEDKPTFQIRSHLTAAALVFAITFTLWLTGLFGGGDVKLITSLALWSGMNTLATTIVVVTLSGAALSIVLLLCSRFWPHTAQILFGPAGSLKPPTNPAHSVGHDPTGEPPTTATKSGHPSLPYGIAISIGGAWVLLQTIAQTGSL